MARQDMFISRPWLVTQGAVWNGSIRAVIAAVYRSLEYFFF